MSAAVFAEPVRILVLAAVLVGTMTTACTDGNEQEATESPMSALAVSCEEYEQAFMDWVESNESDRDDDYAFVLDEIAAHRDTGTEGFFEAALREMAEEFRAGQANIEGAGVSDICKGNIPTPTPTAEGEQRSSFVAAVRSDAPWLTSIADDDLVAAADQICKVLGIGMKENSPQHGYAIITGIVNTALAHDDEDETAPVVRHAVAFYCPEHTAKATELLAAGG